MSGTIFFTTQKNTLKRNKYSGVVSIAGPSGILYSGPLLYGNTTTITHNLGYVPPFRVYYEPFGDGTIWPPLSGRMDGNAQKPTDTTVQGPGMIAWATSTQLNIQLFSGGTTFSGNTYPVYYVIYEDFSLA